MNGKPPAADDPVLTALQTYMFWLASKAPTGVTLEGQGYRKLPAPAQKADYLRGERFTPSTAPCAMALKARPEERQALGLPRLMGADSFNWGAGMHQIGNAAGFIKANMPLGQAGMLSDQEAWDVAYFMNAHERPQDPRYAESVAATRAKYHDSDDSLYGIEVNGHLLGSDSPRPAASCCRRPSPEPLKARGGSGFRPAAPLICYSCGLGITRSSSIHARQFRKRLHGRRAQRRGQIQPGQGPAPARPFHPALGFLHHARAASRRRRRSRISLRGGRRFQAHARRSGPCWNGPRCMAISGTPATASTPPPAKDAMCCSRSTGRARASQAALSGRHRHFHPAAVDRGTRSPAQGARPGRAASHRAPAHGGEAVKSRTLRNANMLLLIKNLA